MLTVLLFCARTLGLPLMPQTSNSFTSAHICVFVAILPFCVTTSVHNVVVYIM